MMFSSYKRDLQDPLDPAEREWSFVMPDLPPVEKINGSGLVKTVSIVSNPRRSVLTLGLNRENSNRAIANDPIDHFLVVSFADFRLRVPKQDSSGETEPASFKVSQDFIVRLLATGIAINGTRYHFYGHSNSQLKSRTCFLYAGSKEAIERKIHAFGNFGSIKTVAKKAKRIGLMFSSADTATRLDSERTEDIEDVERDDYTFTDGCGNISMSFLKQLVKAKDIRFRNRKYVPSVVQIRYRGYKGVLAADLRLRGQIKAQFRKSMKKFSGGDDMSFAVVDYSKPYSFGNLNDEIIILLHSLGISQNTLLERQQQHLDLLTDADRLDAHAAFRLFSYQDRPELAERVLIEGVDAVRGPVRKAVATERNSMINKREEQRCRILIKDSRLLFGICDPVDVLKPGECFVRVTSDDNGLPRTLINTEVLVTRNPCLHPGDLQKFRVVDRPELAHLVDCIVFSTRGKRPAADLMSGGDLDGDKFLVCWDKELIPQNLSQAAEYPGPPERKAPGPITHQDRLEYFAKANNAALGKVKKLYLEWARKRGPHCAECQQLNRLFSQCVDGNRVRVPPILEQPPAPAPDQPPFVLDVLHEEAKQCILTARRTRELDAKNLTFESLEELLSLDDVPLSEMELIQMTQNWCKHNSRSFGEFSCYFDYNQLTSEEKAWVSSHLEVDEALVSNALTQSSLVSTAELSPFRLNDGRLRWKRVFDSSTERMDRFLEVAVKSFESFHRKLVLFRVDARLTLAIYIPRKLSKGDETDIDDRGRVFAFPHTGDQADTYRRVVPTKMNYKVFCDDYLFQMYNLKRRDTWIFIRRAASDDEAYRNVKPTGDRRRARQETLDAGINHDFVASVALNKNSSGLQRHMGRVNRNGILGAEIYVITNRDTAALRTLNLWLEFIDTQDIQCNFSREAREFSVLSLKDVEWASQPDFVQLIVKDNNYSYAGHLSPTDFSRLCKWLLEREEQVRLYRICKHLFEDRSQLDTSTNIALINVLLDNLVEAPYLASIILTGSTETLVTQTDKTLKAKLAQVIPDILKSLILRANDIGSLITDAFCKVLCQWAHASVHEYVEVFELISLAVGDMELAEDLMFQLLEQHSSRVLTERPAVTQRLIRSLLGVALDHIEEVSEAKVKGAPLLSITVKEQVDDCWTCEAPLRIDAPASVRPKMGDHIRLRPAGVPLNAPLHRPTSIDALVTASDPGRLIFRTLQKPPSYAEECSWLLTRCASFTTSKTAFDATFALFSGGSGNCGIAKYLDGRIDREGSTTDTVTSKDMLSKALPNLNKSQTKAVHAAIQNSVTCLWGPPGTGKTHTILSMLEKLIEVDRYRRILVTAPTNNAVDNILQRFATRFPELTVELCAVRVATDSRKVAPEVKSFVCAAFEEDGSYTNSQARKAAQRRVEESSLVFTTCIGAGIGLLRNQSFPTVFVDEASQVTEPTSYVPLVKGCEKAILVGDHVQLRPTVGQHAVVAGLDESLFERLYVSSSGKQLPGLECCMLDTQYRMHESLCAFSSEHFYNGKLKTGVREEDVILPSSSFPWPVAKELPKRGVFIQCSSPEDLGKKSKSNAGQVTACKAIHESLLQVSPDTKKPSMAVLTPYTAQRLALQRALPTTTVSSIDGYQGKEADIIIFVTVRSNVAGEIGFLTDMRRLNVVLTRARCGLIVIGDEATLTRRSEAGNEVEKAIWSQLVAKLDRVELDGEEMPALE